MSSTIAALLLVLGLGRLFEDGADPGLAPAAASPVLVHSLAEALAGVAPVEVPRRPRRLRHRVRPRERVSQIAARYGVRREDLVEWNHLDPGETYPPRRRRTLEVHANRIPPPRRKVQYPVGEDEGWMDVAARFGVERKDLRAWNWQTHGLEPGVVLEVWVDPGLPRTADRSGWPFTPPAFDLPDGGRSIGRPQRGRIEHAVQLPASKLYTRRHLGVLWGSSHTVREIMATLAQFRHDTDYDGEVVVGAISRRGGRRLRPHKSHQSGRDVDIRLPLLAGVPPTNHPNDDEIDWRAAWALVRAFHRRGQAQVIFLEADLHLRLYEAARSMGETPDSLREVITWPNWGAAGDPLVRHADGHDNHIHVRFHCGHDEPRCREH